MQVLLKHGRTGYYYMGRSEWTAEPSDAANFHNIEQALQAIIQVKLDRMSIVIIDDESGTEQVFDLSADVPSNPSVNSFEV